MSTNQISTELLDNNLKNDKLTTSKNKKKVRGALTTINSILPIPSWTYLQSKALASNGTRVCCGVSDGWSDPDTQCIAWQVNSNDVSQLWQLTPDGHFISRVTSNFAMDVSDYNNLVANNWANTKSQNWGFKNGQIVNSNGQCIGMEGALSGPITPTNGVNLIAANQTTVSTDNQCFQWETSPSYPLNAILTQKPNPFPQYTGSLLQDYIQVSQQLANVDDIRTEYNNLAGTLSSWETRLQTFSWCPQEIISQLTNELEYAQSIINLQTCYTTFHSALFEDDSARLNALIALCQLEEGSTTNISGCMLQVFSGLLYTVLSAIPGADGAIAIAPILGNLIQTGINIAVSASSANNQINPDPFEVAISQLWDTLSTNFEGLLNSIGTMVDMMLADWGMMQAVHTLTLKLNTPDSLAWAANMTGDMISAAVPGFQISVLQMLMPTKYQIYRFDSKYGAFPSGIPSYCQWEYAGLLFWVADREHCDVYPVADLMSVLWNNNVKNQDFFFSQNGWNFPTALMSGYSSGIPCIANNTSTPMTMKILYDGILPANFDIKTYSSTWSFDPQDKNTSTYEITVWDINEQYIASLNIHVSLGFFEGSYISLKDSYVKNGYYLGTPVCNQGSFADVFTASIIVPIYQSPPTNN